MPTLHPMPDGVILVAIDIAKARNEVRIEVPGAKRGPRMTVLTERPAGAALGNLQHITDMVDAKTSASGAQKFPRDASCRISLSSVRSAIALRSRLFSVSRSFIRLT